MFHRGLVIAYEVTELFLNCERKSTKANIGLMGTDYWEATGLVIPRKLSRYKSMDFANFRRHTNK